MWMSFDIHLVVAWKRWVTKCGRYHMKLCLHVGWKGDMKVVHV